MLVEETLGCLTADLVYLHAELSNRLIGDLCLRLKDAVDELVYLILH